MDEKTANIVLGNKIAALLNIKFKDGVCKTNIGTKSLQGLGAMVRRYTEEAPIK